MDEDEIAAAAAAAQAATQAAADAAAAEAARKAKEGTSGNDDATAKLARLEAELAAAQAEAAKFAGIDPVKAKADAAAVLAAEKATADAEKAKAEAEGNFEKLRELQNAESSAAIAAAQAEATEAKTAAAKAVEQLNVARIQTAFATSKFVNDETILDATMAVKLYGDHVQIVDGNPVVFDAPEGAAKRTKIMDSKGNPLPFDQAVRKILEAAPNKDSLLKAKTVPGAGSKTQEGKSKVEGTDRLSKLSAGIAKLRGA